MNSNELGQQLHDKATRGASLTPQEQNSLDAWYAQEDATEKESLHSGGNGENVGAIREQVDAALEQLGVAIRRVQEIAAANESLRQEVSALQHRLAQSSAPQSA
jgi:hypothetical protein